MITLFGSRRLHNLVRATCAALTLVTGGYVMPPHVETQLQLTDVQSSSACRFVSRSMLSS